MGEKSYKRWDVLQESLGLILSNQSIGPDQEKLLLLSLPLNLPGQYVNVSNKLVILSSDKTVCGGRACLYEAYANCFSTVFSINVVYCLFP